MSGEISVNDLAGATRALLRAGSPPDVFRALLEASRVVVPRAAVFLVRRGEVHGWGSVGFPSDVARSHRTFRAAGEHGWLGRLTRELSGAPVERPADAVDPDFGQAPSAAAVGCAMCIDDKPIAVVVAERGADEGPWVPQGLALLAGVAGLRLELNLARRKAATAPAETSTGADPVARTEAGSGASAPEPVDAPSPVVASGAKATSGGAAPVLEVARRYARLVATDIRLYNEEAVMLGRRNGDLVARLGEHIGRGKDTFLRRHNDLGPAGLELLHEAYVQVLAGGDEALIPSSALE